MAKPRILLNLFHPNIELSRGNKMLAEEAKKLPNLTFRNLYQECPDFKIDVKKEQKLLLEHDLIVFQHPIRWYSGPALLKEWQDQVLQYGFAYPPGVGDQLKGKCWLSAVTTGGPQEAYRSGGRNNYTISELLRPFQQTAQLCGLTWLPPFVIHSVLPVSMNGISDEELSKQAAEYFALLDGFTIG
jgi:glutathione-regulated potassium-efflux system ancillary protein KefG